MSLARPSRSAAAGSQSGTITVTGQQGHVAYPHLAHNPVTLIARIVSEVGKAILDHGTDHFQPTNLEFISIDVGNDTWNLIPKQATARFNVRHNDLWDGTKLADFILTNAQKCVPCEGYDVRLDMEPSNADAFLTRSEELLQTFSASVKSVTGRTPEFSTGGGTSDARFIKNYCPVIEFGMVGKTMHMVDEHVAVDDLEKLEQVYYTFLERYFRA